VACSELRCALEPIQTGNSQTVRIDVQLGFPASWQNPKLLEQRELSATEQTTTGNRDLSWSYCRFRALRASLL